MGFCRRGAEWVHAGAGARSLYWSLRLKAAPVQVTSRALLLLRHPFRIPYRLVGETLQFHSPERPENLADAFGQIGLLLRGMGERALQNLAGLLLHGAPVHGRADFQLALGGLFQVPDGDVRHAINDSIASNACNR